MKNIELNEESEDPHHLHPMDWVQGGVGGTTSLPSNDRPWKSVEQGVGVSLASNNGKKRSQRKVGVPTSLAYNDKLI